MRSRLVFLCTVVILLLTGCSEVVSSRSLASPLDDWKFADLLYLDSFDRDDPVQDLIAVYSRQSPEKIQIRLDFLDVPPQPNIRIELNVAFQLRSWVGDTISIDAQPQILKIRVINGLEPTIENQKRQPVNLDPKAYWQTELDYVVIEINNPDFASTHRLENISALILDDKMQPAAPPTPQIPNAALPSSYNAPLLLEFYELMPGFTPAQSLRRWDGAHTGPYGQRHGLRYLLQAVEKYEVPVILLDVKKPNSLAALNYLGQIEKIRQLAKKGLLTLPDVGIGDPESAEQSLRLSKTAGQNFGIPEQAFIFAPLSSKSDIFNDYKAAFAVLPDSASINSWHSSRLIPLPQAFQNPHKNETEIDQNGLTLEAKRQLVKAAQLGTAQTIIAFGGDLSKSAWGDAQSSQLAFQYIKSHPWIHVLTQQDLVTFPVRQNFAFQDCANLLCAPPDLPLKPYSSSGSTKSSAPAYPELKSIIRRELETLPESELTNQTWKMFLNLTRPTINAALQQLQANYLGNVGHLIAGIKWLQNPVPIHTCSVDLDWDGAPDCILASTQLFTTYKLDGARLLILIVRDDQNARQWFGSVSQFAVGLSDPTDWKIERGPASDPNEIPGAFSDTTDTFQPFTAEIEENYILFTATNDNLQKLFTLDNNSLLVEYRSKHPLTTRIPLLILPEQRDTSEWKEYLDRMISGENLRDSLLPHIQLVAANSNQDSFYDSYEQMKLPENPSFSYPPGHYLPFPLTLLTVQAPENFSVMFTFQP